MLASMPRDDARVQTGEFKGRGSNDKERQHNSGSDTATRGAKRHNYERLVTLRRLDVNANQAAGVLQSAPPIVRMEMTPHSR